jgi:hypothetical protein
VLKFKRKFRRLKVNIQKRSSQNAVTDIFIYSVYCSSVSNIFRHVSHHRGDSANPVNGKYKVLESLYNLYAGYVI